MNRMLAALLAALAVAVFIGASSLFIITPANQALVLQFGEIKRTVREPGLHAKLPFVQNVVYLDSRVLDFDPPSKTFILGDKTRLIVDTFTRYRITDPQLFYTSVRNEETLQTRLENTVDSALRETFPKFSLASLLSDEREQVMTAIRGRVNNDVKRFGIEVVDLRIRRADLPAENSEAVFARMRSERQREAAELRAQGEEQAKQVRSRADRESTVIKAEAESRAKALTGEGDNQAIRIISEAVGRDPQFYAFYRTLEAYRTALRSEDTTFVLTPQGDFFQYFNDVEGQSPATAPRR